jgi:hypothetical protein
MPCSLVRPALVGLALAGLLLVVLVPAAAACPFCDGGPTGRNETREAIFGPDFWPNLAVAALPFLVVGAVAAAVHFGPPGPRLR